MIGPRRILFLVPALALLAGAIAVPAARAEDAAMPAGVKGEILMWIKYAEGELVELSDAIPEAKYSWRPGKDKTVRSVGEVFMHVAAANYNIPSFWGVAPPEGFKFETYEKSLTRKEDIQKALKDSFARMEQGLIDLPDADLDKQVEFFGIKTTVRGGYLLVLSHDHEHLGQSIAYARSNNIVPPWTAREQAAAKEAEATKDASAKKDDTK